MDIQQPLQLLGGLSPRQFMKRHWQKKPLLVRQAIPGFTPLLDRTALFDLASLEDVESRLLSQGSKGWQFRRGPFQRRSLPALKTPDWTLLVQGVDLHDDGVHQLMQQFRFVPDARLDDVMISYATNGGGVGPHFDSYDVFLLQAHGQRRWRIGRQKDLSLVDGLPLKILANFQPEEEYVLEPGDMLYLPPRWAHDGVAVGECMTYSIGFRQPARGELARELLQRLAEDAEDAAGSAVYRDPGQGAVEAPGGIPPEMMAFARDALQAVLDDPIELQCLLGEYLSEPKANVWFDTKPAVAGRSVAGAVALDRRTRMMFDDQHIFINGESYRASGRDAQLMRQLADQRRLSVSEVKRASQGARQLMSDWLEAGWLHDDQ
ncbi:MAG TPA: cupin domain-containing protein [Burkholderiaceae bacterium]|nr:cupin domain-containing protein [Burkholderiaceae bacterium]